MILYDFVRPDSLEQVSELLASKPGKSKVIAGGTDLLVQLRNNDKKLQSLELVIDLSALASELATVREEGDYLIIGALMTHNQVEQNELIQREFRHLSKASASVGSPQIRKLGTLGGGVCNGSPASDVVPALLSSDAEVLIFGKNGQRSQALIDFAAMNGKGALADDEFVSGFKLRKLPASAKTGFSKVGRRKALAISRLNAAVVLVLDENNKISDARIAPGCIFRTPDRVTEAEQSLIGKEISQEAFAEAGEIVSKVMIERTGYRWSTPYKEIAVKAVVTDALCDASGLEVF